ncbi:hypothetical protein A3H55_01700 [Candidatus Kuenenbacteria bacterium RIFCSPLOWO2_02_FULL_42_16]|uniref:UDP-N-acetylglucosamine--N-acetylmuramyl-(pentapeptide) pyrophosphoryl-undecaprenol N-acetylglucosamine transferase n=1 Tax=Candidatus Kuenenbacteria bacterium RIFCSPLOWO2_02_FULL_42_16 TaxID=1798564 RepID=A0A1F6FXR3_9BACT|nr:MAG: hypothetical protein A3H55_01700 [Candidatus Kuenenbacteria bacterium RIFCSPLOWO2_02_FULL_42_16]
MKILFTGGGTMGSVTPLIAVAEVLKARDPGCDLFWLGTRSGPEERVIRRYNIDFKGIFSGKLRRYFSMENVLDVFKIIIGFWQAVFILIKLRPQAIVSAGGFVAVPVVWAGWLLGIPNIVHQQDVQAGLANKLCGFMAKKITVCFPATTKYFKKNKTEIIGNPVRNNLRAMAVLDKEELLERLNLKKDWPVVLVTGGGTGALALNQLVFDSLKELTKFCQVVHLTGENKADDDFSHENYIHYDFLVNIIPFIKIADLIVTRAGMGTLMEIGYLKKPALVMPIPRSHQVANADYFYERGAVEILDQEKIDSDDLIKRIKELLDGKSKLKELSKKIHEMIKWGAEERLAEIILETARKI